VHYVAFEIRENGGEVPDDIEQLRKGIKRHGYNGPVGYIIDEAVKFLKEEEKMPVSDRRRLREREQACYAAHSIRRQKEIQQDEKRRKERVASAFVSVFSPISWLRGIRQFFHAIERKTRPVENNERSHDV
jgi:hypothetical protein